MKKTARFILMIALCLIVPLGAPAEDMTALTFDGFTCYVWNDWHYLVTKNYFESTSVTYTKTAGTRLDDILVIQTEVAESAEEVYDHGQLTEDQVQAFASEFCKDVYSIEYFNLNGVKSALIIGSYPTGTHDYHVICLTRKDNVGAAVRLGVSTKTIDEARVKMMEVLGIDHFDFETD